MKPSEGPHHPGQDSHIRITPSCPPLDKGQTARFLSVANNGNSVTYSFQHSILWQTEVLSPVQSSFVLIKPHFSGLIFLWKHALSLSPLKSIQVPSNEAQPRWTSSSLALSVPPPGETGTQDTIADPREVTVQRGGKFHPCLKFLVSSFSL